LNNTSDFALLEEWAMKVGPLIVVWFAQAVIVLLTLYIFITWTCCCCCCRNKKITKEPKQNKCDVCCAIFILLLAVCVSIAGFVVGTQVEPSLKNFMCSTVDFMYTFVEGDDSGDTNWLGLEELTVDLQSIHDNLGDVPALSTDLKNELSNVSSDFDAATG
jgi:hypothetical protein